MNQLNIKIIQGFRFTVQRGYRVKGTSYEWTLFTWQVKRQHRKQAISKKSFFDSILKEHEFQAGEIRLYFEKLKLMPNTDIGAKNFFEIAYRSFFINFHARFRYYINADAD